MKYCARSFSSLLKKILCMAVAFAILSCDSTSSDTSADQGSETKKSSEKAQPVGDKVLLGIEALPKKPWLVLPSRAIPSSRVLAYLRGTEGEGSSRRDLGESERKSLGNTLVVKDNRGHYFVRHHVLQSWMEKINDDATSKARAWALLKAMLRRPSTDYYASFDQLIKISYGLESPFSMREDIPDLLKISINLMKEGRSPTPGWSEIDFSEERSFLTGMLKGALALSRLYKNHDPAGLLKEVDGFIKAYPKAIYPLLYAKAILSEITGNNQASSIAFAGASNFQSQFKQSSSLSKQAYERAHGGLSGFDTFFKGMREHYESEYENGKVRSYMDVPAPNFKLSGWNGQEELSFSDVEADVILLDFWAHWCGPCRVELPIVQDIANKLHPRVKLITVALDHRGAPERVPMVAASLNLTAPLLNDASGSVGSDYRLRSFPTLYIISKGRIRYRHMGVDENTRSSIMKEVNFLLSNPKLL